METVSLLCLVLWSFSGMILTANAGTLFADKLYALKLKNELAQCKTKLALAGLRGLGNQNLLKLRKLGHPRIEIERETRMRYDPMRAGELPKDDTQPTKSPLVANSPIMKLINPLKFDPSQYGEGDYIGWVHWLQNVPTPLKLKNAAEGMTRRMAHSFLNHETDNLAGMSPPMDHLHQVVNGVGKLLLPDPRLLDHFDDDVTPIIHPHSHLGRVMNGVVSLPALLIPGLHNLLPLGPIGTKQRLWKPLL